MTPEQLLVFFIIAGVFGWACLGVWSWVFLRKRDELPVLPIVRRRPVPWGGIDIAIFFVANILLAFVFLALAGLLDGFPSVASEKVVSTNQETVSGKLSDAGSKVEQGEIEAKTKKKGAKAADSGKNALQKETSHDIAAALRNASPGVIVFCFFIAVFFAPFTEEIVFRMFLQGYLEKLDTHFRLQSRRIARYQGRNESRSSIFELLPWGVAPIFIVSMVFAMLHFRFADEVPPAERVVRQMTIHALSVTTAVIFLLFWLRLVRGAKLSDFGIVPREIPRDMLRGFIAFLAIGAPVYLVQIVATAIVPKEIAPDPISIFVLSLAFGTVWCRTHRLIPSIVMHMSLNAASMGMVLYFFG